MRTPLPPSFHSDYEGEPFAECQICNADLTEPGRTHIVLKYQHTRRDAKPETIIEFAACLECLQTHAPSPSAESLKEITSFRSEKMAARPFVIPPPGNGVPNDCEMCGTSLSECRTFSMRAEVVADENGELQIALRPSLAWVAGSPILMCETCSSELSERISSSTREGWDKFYEDFVDQPPVVEFDGTPSGVIL